VFISWDFNLLVRHFELTDWSGKDGEDTLHPMNFWKFERQDIYWNSDRFLLIAYVGGGENSREEQGRWPAEETPWKYKAIKQAKLLGLIFWTRIPGRSTLVASFAHSQIQKITRVSVN
jgi:hypothetical protein